MPGWSGAVGSNVIKTYGITPATSQGTLLTGASARNAKSGYTPLVQSLEFNASGMLVNLSVSNGAGGATFFVDIAVGAIGSEVDIIKNLSLCGVRNEISVNYIFDTLLIPAGSRLSARYQVGGGASNVTGTTADIMLIPFYDDISDVLALGRVTTYGVIPTNTSCAVVDPGGSANAVGAWTALVASSNYSTHSMLIVLDQLGNGALTNARYIVDIGIGAAGQEKVLFSFPFEAGNTSDFMIPQVIGPLHFNIPAGTRISARAQCSITDATDRLFGLALYCMD